MCTPRGVVGHHRPRVPRWTPSQTSRREPVGRGRGPRREWPGWKRPAGREAAAADARRWCPGQEASTGPAQNRPCASRRWHRSTRRCLPVRTAGRSASSPRCATGWSHRGTTSPCSGRRPPRRRHGWRPSRRRCASASARTRWATWLPTCTRRCWRRWHGGPASSTSSTPTSTCWRCRSPGSSRTPTVLTLHGRLDLDFVRELLPRYGSVPLVSISNDQRRAVGDLDLTWAATVYNGLDLSRYRDGAARQGRLPRLRGPDRSGEGAAVGDRGLAAHRRAPAHGGQGRPDRRHLLRGGGGAADGLRRRLRRRDHGGREAGLLRRCPRHPLRRATGPSRSGW